MSTIRIVKVPPGEAPEFVRRAWVGVEFPTIELPTEDRIEIGIFGGESGNIGGYEVDVHVALEALRQVRPEMFVWWMENMNVEFTAQALVFRRDVCEVISE